MTRVHERIDTVLPIDDTFSSSAISPTPRSGTRVS